MEEKHKETRTQLIKRYMTYSKKDLAILYVDAQYCIEEIVKQLSKKKKESVKNK